MYRIEVKNFMMKIIVTQPYYLTHSKFNSLLTEMITPQTYKYYAYKTVSCLSCIFSGLAPNYCITADFFPPLLLKFRYICSQQHTWLLYKVCL